MKSTGRIQVLIIVTALSFGILAGCKATSHTASPAVSPTSTLEVNQDKIMKDYQVLLKNSDTLIEAVKFMDENVSKVSTDNAVIMVVEFEKAQKQFLPKLEDEFYKDNGAVQTKINELNKPGFDINKIDDIEDVELKALLTKTRDSGYKVETAEGMFFPIINYEFYKKYSDKVTPDIKEYIDLMAVESNNMPAKDAALVIGWEEVLKRALNQEKYIAQYKNSTKIDDVKALYKRYLTFTLLGLNNTPLFSYDSNLMDSDARKAYENLLKDGKDSDFIKILNDYMEMIKKNNYKLTDDLDKYRKDILDNLK